MPDADLLSSADVAATLEIKTSRVRQLARQHGLGRQTTGGRVFTPADVDRLRQRKTTRGPERGAERRHRAE